MSEYPHERELVANEREVMIASLTSSNAELQTKLNEATRRASWFQKQSQLSQSAVAQEVEMQKPTEDEVDELLTPGVKAGIRRGIEDSNEGRVRPASEPTA